MRKRMNKLNNSWERITCLLSNSVKWQFTSPFRLANFSILGGKLFHLPFRVDSSFIRTSWTTHIDYHMLISLQWCAHQSIERGFVRTCFSQHHIRKHFSCSPSCFKLLHMITLSHSNSSRTWRALLSEMAPEFLIPLQWTFLLMRAWAHNFHIVRSGFHMKHKGTSTSSKMKPPSISLLRNDEQTSRLNQLCP